MDDVRGNLALESSRVKEVLAPGENSDARQDPTHKTHKTRSAADYAGFYVEQLGMHLVPIPRGWKYPHGFNGWQKPDSPHHFAAPDRAREWWSQHPDHGIGCPLGQSGFCSFDADLLEHTRAVFQYLGLDADALIEAGRRVIGNPERARSLFLEPEGVRLTRKVLQWPHPEDPAKSVTVFELRGGDVQDILPPTEHPDTGQRYRWPDPPHSRADFRPLPPELRELWQRWDDVKQDLEALCPWANAVSVIAEFNERHDAGAILRAHGYAYEEKRKRFLAPGSSTGIPGVVVFDDGTGRAKVYSHHGSDPLSAGRNGGHSLDAFDLFRLLEHGGDQTAAVKAAAELLGISGRTNGAPIQVATTAAAPEPWPDPAPLPKGLPAVESFDGFLLPDALRPWIEDVAERMQCPPDYPAVAATVALATVVGRKVCIRPKRRDDWLVVPNLWGMIVGRPGVLKTPPVVEATNPLRRLEVAAKKAYDEALQEWQARQEIASINKGVRKKKLEQRLKAGTDSATLAKELLKDEADDEPTRVRLIVNDSSVEKLGEILGENPNGVLSYRDELIGLLKGLDKEGQESARAFYLEAWAGDSRFTYDRIGRGTLDIESVILSVLGCIPPGPLREYLRGSTVGEGGDDGLMQRFQLTVWPDVAAEWRNVDRWPDSEARTAAYDTFARLHTLSPDDVEAERDRFEPDGLRFLRFDDVAQEMFDAWRAELEHKVRSGTEHPALESHLAKYRSLVPSLALLTHLADGYAGPVGEASTLVAIAWAQYLETHARRLYSTVTGYDAVPGHALAKRIRSGDVQEGFSVRDVYPNGWANLASKEDVQGAVSLLEDLGWIRPELVKPSPQGGRPTTRYRINPKIAGGAE
jgi:hypothetical protein